MQYLPISSITKHASSTVEIVIEFHAVFRNAITSQHNRMITTLSRRTIHFQHSNKRRSFLHPNIWHKRKAKVVGIKCPEERRKATIFKPIKPPNKSHPSSKRVNHFLRDVVVLSIRIPKCFTCVLNYCRSPTSLKSFLIKNCKISSLKLLCQIDKIWQFLECPKGALKSVPS